MKKKKRKEIWTIYSVPAGEKKPSSKPPPKN